MIKEENKYYTPSIEEFHVGFEYEVYDRLHNIWNKENNFFLQQGDFDDSIRVKYLDQEDIESLGWIIDDRNSKILYCCVEDGRDIYMDYNIESKFCKISLLEEDLFKGTIKNKSELKFIMQCLGISE